MQKMESCRPGQERPVDGSFVIRAVHIWLFHQLTCSIGGDGKDWPWLLDEPLRTYSVHVRIIHMSLRRPGCKSLGRSTTGGISCPSNLSPHRRLVFHSILSLTPPARGGRITVCACGNCLHERHHYIILLRGALPEFAPAFIAASHRQASVGLNSLLHSACVHTVVTYCTYSLRSAHRARHGRRQPQKTSMQPTAVT